MYIYTNCMYIEVCSFITISKFKKYYFMLYCTSMHFMYLNYIYNLITVRKKVFNYKNRYT